jgi:hypothetical protein
MEAFVLAIIMDRFAPSLRYRDDLKDAVINRRIFLANAADAYERYIALLDHHRDICLFRQERGLEPDHYDETGAPSWKTVTMEDDEWDARRVFHQMNELHNLRIDEFNTLTKDIELYKIMTRLATTCKNLFGHIPQVSS